MARHRRAPTPERMQAEGEAPPRPYEEKIEIGRRFRSGSRCERFLAKVAS